MKIIKNKNFKIKQIKKIKQSYKYFYFFRYNNITTNEIILIKKKLKKINIKTIIIKKKFLTKDLIPLQTEGCILLLYTNNYIKVIKNIFLIKKINFLFFLHDENLYSKHKYINFLFNSNKKLNSVLLNPIYFFASLIKKI